MTTQRNSNEPPSSLRQSSRRCEPGHNGFDHSVLTAQLQAAGFTEITIQSCHNMVRDGITYPLFLAIARH